MLAPKLSERYVAEDLLKGRVHCSAGLVLLLPFLPPLPFSLSIDTAVTDTAAAAGTTKLNQIHTPPTSLVTTISTISISISASTSTSILPITLWHCHAIEASSISIKVLGLPRIILAAH